MFYLFSSPDRPVSSLSYLTFAFSFTLFPLSWLFTFCKEKLEFCKEKAPELIPIYIQQIWQDDAKRVRNEELRVKSEERRVIFSLHSSLFTFTAPACFSGFPLCQGQDPTEEDLPFVGWGRGEAQPLASPHPTKGKGPKPLAPAQRVLLVLFSRESRCDASPWIS